jgi:hypothetical protein
MKRKGQTGNKIEEKASLEKEAEALSGRRAEE